MKANIVKTQFFKMQIFDDMKFDLNQTLRSYRQLLFLFSFIHIVNTLFFLTLLFGGFERKKNYQQTQSTTKTKKRIKVVPQDNSQGCYGMRRFESKNKQITEFLHKLTVAFCIL